MNSTFSLLLAFLGLSLLAELGDAIECYQCLDGTIPEDLKSVLRSALGIDSNIKGSCKSSKIENCGGDTGCFKMAPPTNKNDKAIQFTMKGCMPSGETVLQSCTEDFDKLLQLKPNSGGLQYNFSYCSCDAYLCNAARTSYITGVGTSLSVLAAGVMAAFCG